MITTKYNFKQRMRQKYPDITFTPVYGTNAYLFNKELDAVDMYNYSVTQLANGQYLCFVGSKPQLEIITALNNGLAISRRTAAYAPSTFASFETYLQQHDIEPIHRTHIQDQSANEALFTDKPEWNTKRNWYMYELPKNAITPHPQTPMIETENGTVVLLIKASTSSYISKKKLFMQKFTRMQPLYEQIVAACAVEDWDHAAELCSQYATIQFEHTLRVKDINAMKEAYTNGLLRVYTREIESFEVAQDDEAL